MNQIQEQIKECRRELVKRSEEDTRIQLRNLDTLESTISIAS